MYWSPDFQVSLPTTGVRNFSGLQNKFEHVEWSYWCFAGGKWGLSKVFMKIPICAFSRPNAEQFCQNTCILNATCVGVVLRINWQEMFSSRQFFSLLLLVILKIGSLPPNYFPGKWGQSNLVYDCRYRKQRTEVRY